MGDLSLVFSFPLPFIYSLKMFQRYHACPQEGPSFLYLRFPILAFPSIFASHYLFNFVFLCQRGSEKTSKRHMSNGVQREMPVCGGLLVIYVKRKTWKMGWGLLFFAKGVRL